MTPKVSILLPVYNNESTVLAAVNSILNQTFSDFELLIINDGSTDHTGSILETLDDPRVQIIGGADNLGLPQRLNQGLAWAQGMYIARMDADDIAFPDRFEKQVAYLELHPQTDVVATRAVVFNYNNEIVGLLPFAADHCDIVSKPWNSIPMPHPTWMMRREWALRYRYAVPEVWRAEDQDLLLRAHSASTYACLPDILLLYRQGRFDFKKIAVARCHLVRAQAQYFVSHGQYFYAFLSGLVFVVKSIWDMYRYCLFGCGFGDDRRKNFNISQDVRDAIFTLLRQK